jgi:hypothetical protein
LEVADSFNNPQNSFSDATTEISKTIAKRPQLIDLEEEEIEERPTLKKRKI